jgi:hypothetical protein
MDMVKASHSRCAWLGLMTVVVILLIPCCWLAAEWQDVRMDREAVAAIQKTGGYVEYGELNGPAWLRKVLGDDWFRHVTAVHCYSDADLECVKGFPQVQALVLQGTGITDTGLKHFKGLARLAVLYLNDTQITDAGLKCLEGLTQLLGVGLDGTKITDAGLEHLKGLAQLQTLSLGHTQITDAGLEHLKGLASLQRLSLKGTRVSDTGVKKLQSALPKCQIER